MVPDAQKETLELVVLPESDEFQKGFDAMRAGKSGKVVLDWS